MKRQLALLPLVGIAIFLCIYFYAASIYPGGTFLHHEAKGYSHFNNFWCDLTDKITYAGVPNPSRPIAVFGIIVLFVSLIFFWYYVPTLFGDSKWNKRIVRSFGCPAMIVATLLPLAHDTIINIGFLMGIIAFSAVLVGLLRQREFKIFGLAIVAIAFCVTNFFMWHASYHLDLMPFVQKMAFITFFIWVGVTVRQYRTLLN